MGNSSSQEEQIKQLRRELDEINERATTQKKQLQSAKTLNELQRREISQLLRKDVKRFRPSIPPIINIGLIGFMGTGKSSLVNSLKYAVDGALDTSAMQQTAPAIHQGGYSLRRNKVQMTPYIYVIDNRGAANIDSPTFKAVLTEQLEGRGNFVENVDWKTLPQRSNVEVEGDKIYCCIIVVNGQNPDNAARLIRPLVPFLLQWQGYYPIAVITHKDVAKKMDFERAKSVLESAGISSIYTVSNIVPSQRSSLDPEDEEQLLRLILTCTNMARDVFAYRREVENAGLQQGR